MTMPVNDDPKNPTMVSEIFDTSEFTPYEAHLGPGERQGMKVEHNGFDEVRMEIVDNQADWGEKAGIAPSDITEFQLLNERIERLDAFLPPFGKRYQVLLETRAFLADKREKLVNNVALSVDRRADAEPALLGRYQKTRAYRSAAAMKAAKSRRRAAANEAAEAAKGKASEKAQVPEGTETTATVPMQVPVKAPEGAEVKTLV